MSAGQSLDLRPTPVAEVEISNIEAEQGVLGAALYDDEAFARVSGLLRPEHFREPFHGRLWAYIAKQRAIDRSCDLIVTAEKFKADPAFDSLGGGSYLADLVDHCPATAAVPDLAAVVVDLAARREMVALARDMLTEARQGTRPAAELLVDSERRISELALDGPAKDAWKPGGVVIRSAIESALNRNGNIEFGSGVEAVDSFIGGFNRGEMSIIAGRPGMAKSTVGLTIARANAAVGLGTAFFSQEMADEPLGLRLACDIAYDRDATMYSGASQNPTYDAARKGLLNGDQWNRLREAGEIVDDWPILFDTRAGLTVSEIEVCSRRAHRQWIRRGIKPGPVIVDHLGIVRPEKERQGSKSAETGDVSRGLAEMAKRLDVPVIVLCQINRANEGRDDKRPTLSDLRWSGQIEEDARLVTFLYRPEYYCRAPDDGVTEDPVTRAERTAKLDRVRYKLFWIVAKNNNGQVGQVETFCDVACGAIRDPRRRVA